MTTLNTLTFVEAIKNAGVSISNEQRFIALMENAEDQGLVLSRVLRDRRNDIDFRGTRHFSSERLTEAFKTHNLDGFAWKEFSDHMKFD